MYWPIYNLSLDSVLEKPEPFISFAYAICIYELRPSTPGEPSKPLTPTGNSTQEELASGAIPKSAAVFITAVNPFKGLADSEVNAPEGSILNALSHSGNANHSSFPKSPSFPKKPIGIKLYNFLSSTTYIIIPTLLLPVDHTSLDCVNPS